MNGAVGPRMQNLTATNDNHFISQDLVTSPDRGCSPTEEKRQQDCIVGDTNERNTRQILLDRHEAEMFQHEVDHPDSKLPVLGDRNVICAQAPQRFLKIIGMMPYRDDTAGHTLVIAF
jgi:hypothetical protein